jgi:salicylate hydroxylase
MTAPEKLKLAIIGAGIAGLTTFIALSEHPRLDITIYERAAELQEIGASIALGPNGLRTLERLGLHEVISEKNCFRGPSNLPMVYRHWKTGEVIGVDRHENVTEWAHRTARFHRGHLHGKLLEEVKKRGSKVVLGKKVVGVRLGEQNEVEVEFEDGEVVRTDLLVGADGIKSVCTLSVLYWRSQG